MSKHNYYLKRLSRAALFVLSFVLVAFVHGCSDDDKVNGGPKPDPIYASFKNYGSSRAVADITLENNGGIHYVYFTLSGAAKEDVTADFAIDASLVAEYNADNGTSYELFPTDQVAIPNNGEMTITKGWRQSELTAITFTKGDISEGTTYLLPLKLSILSGDVEMSSEVVYCLISYEPTLVSLRSKMELNVVPFDLVSSYINHVDTMYFSLTKPVGFNVKAKLAIDVDEVAKYNAANGKNYELFPTDRVTIPNDGEMISAAGAPQSKTLNISFAKGLAGKEAKTYLLPLRLSVTSPTAIDMAEDGQVIYYLLTVMPDKPTLSGYTKPITTMVYIETDRANPLNAGVYRLKDTSVPFFDIVSLLTANITYNVSTELPYLDLNDDMTHLLTYKEKYIKPLQAVGIKVTLSLAGGGDRSGVASLTGAKADYFVSEVKRIIDRYELDGIDIDDKLSEYLTDEHPDYADWAPSKEKTLELVYKLRQAMPDKLITFKERVKIIEVPGGDDLIEDYLPGANDEYLGQTLKDLVDFSSWPNHEPGINQGNSKTGMPNEKYSRTVTSFVDQTNLPSSAAFFQSQSNIIVNTKCGIMTFYDLRNNGAPGRATESSKVLYGGKESHVVGPNYQKDWGLENK